MGRELSSEAHQYIMGHDAAETLTGDIPTPAKEVIGADFTKCEEIAVPWLPRVRERVKNWELVLIKCADLGEAWYFADRYCCDPRKEQVMNGIWDELMSYEKVFPDIVLATRAVLFGNP
jgi:hypothetical protein